MTRSDPDPARKRNFARNIGFLCSAYRSVSEICRLTGINRQQFGRYLNGTYLPSRHNLMRICDVLAVSKEDLFLPEALFAEIIELRFPELGAGAGAGWLGRSLERRFPTMDQTLQKYLGWYAAYSYSFGWPNMVLRSLVRLHRYRGRVFSQTIDRVKDPTNKRRFVYKTEGIVTMSAGKILIAEHDRLESDGFYVKLMQPTPRSHVGLLSGLMTGTSHRAQRDVSSVRIVMHYLGPTVDIRSELSRCGIYEPIPSLVNPGILAMIHNDIPQGKTTLQPTPAPIRWA